MIGTPKFESMALGPREDFVVAGTLDGQLYILDVGRWSVVSATQAHAGAIQAVAAHPALPYVAALSTDRSVSVWSHVSGALRHVCTIPIRKIFPPNDKTIIESVHSTSQALGFHDTQRRMVTRSGNSAVVEIDFEDDGSFWVRSCVRLHGSADLISARYVHGGDAVLTGSIDGQLVLSHNGTEVRRWIFDARANIHWAEWITGDEYLLASDLRNVFRIDINLTEPLVTGRIFTRDDLEHVTFNRASGRAYVASFDRNIYEIDPATCNPVGIAFRAPFKCRWIKTLVSDPDVLLVQCRNGGLYKVDVMRKKQIGSLNFAPDALWTAVRVGNDILIAGEGSKLHRYRNFAPSSADRSPIFIKSAFDISHCLDSYTKRMAWDKVHRRLFLARTNGDLLRVACNTDFTNCNVDLSLNLGSAVRDIAIDPTGSFVFAACEGSQVFRISAESGAVGSTWRSAPDQPVWSLAHAPERGILAAAERGGKLAILDDVSLEEIDTEISTGRPKRMKVDGDILFFVKRDELHKLDLSTGVTGCHVQEVGNTIEDFIWDAERRYLILVGYHQNIILCDYDTGDMLCTVPDQAEYTKGVIWANPSGDRDSYPLDFLTFGRSGIPHLFRVYDERILALGPIGKSPSQIVFSGSAVEQTDTLPPSGAGELARLLTGAEKFNV